LISIDPGFAIAYTWRAAAKFKLEDYYGAIEDYDLAISIDPKDTEAHSGLAAAKFKLKNYHGEVEVPALHL
jgi:tetratricopeptide (TPR) repeat protein